MMQYEKASSHSILTIETIIIVESIAVTEMMAMIIHDDNDGDGHSYKVGNDDHADGTNSGDRKMIMMIVETMTMIMIIMMAEIRKMTIMMMP